MVDVIINYVAREKEVSLEKIVEEVKKYNGSDENDIKGILNTLEEEGLIEVNYKLTRCYVKWIGPNFAEEKKGIEIGLDEIKEEIKNEIKDEAGELEKDVKVVKAEERHSRTEKEDEKEGKKDGKSSKERKSKHEKSEKREKFAEKKEKAKETEEKKEKMKDVKKEEIIKQVEDKKDIIGEKRDEEEKSFGNIFGNIFLILIVCAIFASLIGLYFIFQTTPTTMQPSSLVDEKVSEYVTVTPTVETEEEKEMKNISRDENEVTLYIHFYNYGFSPNKIEVEHGKNVKLIIKNFGDPYRLVIKEYNISVFVSDEAVVEFVADKKGTFYYKADGIPYIAEGIIVVK